jgi:Protein of unknown function (DUF2812).
MKPHAPLKLVFSLDYDGLEGWLNEQSSKGVHLVRIGWWGYKFEKDEAKRYAYKIELLKNPRKSIESQNYLHFLKEMGIEAIPTKGVWNRWVWFRGESFDQKLNFYSDIDSRLERYININKILRFFPALFVLSLLLYLSRLIIGALFDISSISLIDLYLPIFTGIFTYGYLKNRAKIRKLKEEKRIRE